MSLTYKRKSRGPRMDPCGTPQDKLPASEVAFSTVTKKVIFSK